MKKNKLTKNYLMKEYSIREKSTSRIAKELNCSHSTILKYLKKYNISIRTISEATKGEKNFYFGKKRPEHSKWMKTHNSTYIDGRTNKKYYCKCGKKITPSSSLYGGKLCRKCADKAHSKRMKEMWKTEKYRNKTVEFILKANKIKPNKPEKLLNKLLNRLLLNEYKYIGDGKVIFCGFNPDFININGQKKIIELFGDYWHKRPEVIERDKRRLIAYKKLGYKTLIVWQHELEDLYRIKEKIIEFNKRKNNGKSKDIK